MPLEQIKGETINVATGVDESVEQIADMILELLGKPAALKAHIDDRPGQVDRHIGSTDRAERLLGWTSKHRVRGRAGAHDRVVPGPPGMVAEGAGGRDRRPRPSDADRPRRRSGAAAGDRGGRRAGRCARWCATATRGSVTSRSRARTRPASRRAARRARCGRADRAGHRLAGADRRLRGRGPRPGPPAGRWRRRCCAPTRCRSARRSTVPACRSRRGRWRHRRRTRASSRRPTARASAAMTIVAQRGRRRAGGADRARRGSRSGRVLFESFVPGPEVTVNGFSVGRAVPCRWR